MNRLLSSIRSFVLEDDGSEILEYALIIAVASIGLTVSLSAVTGVDVNGFVTRVTDCLTTSTCA